MKPETRRLKLRRLVQTDAAFILELLNDPDWLRHIGERDVHTLADARAYIETEPMAMHREHGHGLDAIELRETATAVGICGLLQRDILPDPALGYGLLPAWRGRGIAREAAEAAVHHGFQTLGLKRINAIVSINNHASIRLLRELGFEREGEFEREPNGIQLDLYRHLGQSFR